MSTLNVSNITDGTTTVGTSYVVNGSVKAWAHYDNSGSFETRDTFNTSSLTDTATGRCTINFSSNMSDGNYASPASGGDEGASITLYALNPQSQSSSSTELRGRRHAGSTTTGLADLTFNFVAIHGDLA